MASKQAGRKQIVESGSANVRPVAVVAIGDVQMEDDGVALRVMGRVRPLLGEIALVGRKVAPNRRRGRQKSSGVSGQGSPAWLRAATLPATPGAGRSKQSGALNSLVDWIEGTNSIASIEPMLTQRKRVVLLVPANHGGSPGAVRHWHIGRNEKTKLSTVSFYTSVLDLSLDHLPFWMEEEIPAHGTDLIAIEPYRVGPSHELSPIMRSRLAGITSQVGGLLVRILEEEGWRLDRRSNPRTRSRSSS
jgi:hypothetical protein